jgi:L-ascorbate metabolism protein UlaG (beta-lactamase superfamily)
MKRPRKMLLFSFSILMVLAIAGWIFLQQAVFGSIPAAQRLERIAKSPHYKNGSFENLSFTEVMRKEGTTWGMLKDYYNKPKTTIPPRAIPTVKTDLKALPDSLPTVVWFGHSSYLIKSQGFTVLVDPVFSGSASPVALFGKAFKGSDAYTVDDLPAIDLLVISHDHYDHLDYKTLVELLPKVKQVVAPLGVGAHLERWGFDAKTITELDWWENHKVAEKVDITATPARHFSGRSFKRGQTLWAAYVLHLHGHSVFVGGDSGYDTHFRTIGEKYGPFELAILECGQYGKDWPLIHTTPEETITAALDLKAKMLLPVHWAKFELALHEWNDPIIRVVKSAHAQGQSIATPHIGEPVVLGSVPPNTAWWHF